MDVPSTILQPGERFLWSGRPQRVAPAGLEWVRPLGGSVLVAGLAAAVLPFQEPGLPFAAAVFTLAAGLGGVWWPVLARPWGVGRAGYAVTDRRVVVADRVSGRLRRQAALGPTPPTVTWLGHGGLGTLTFGAPDLVVDVFGYSVPVRWRGRLDTIRLIAVPEPDRIRELVEQAVA